MTTPEMVDYAQKHDINGRILNVAKHTKVEDDRGGQTAEEVQDFLTGVRKWPADTAHDYYRRALAKLNHQQEH